MGLIAKVTVVAMVDGERKEFAPGDPLPDMHKHDIEALKKMGAIEDPADTDAALKAAKAAEKKAGAEFNAARKAVQSAEESTGNGAA